MAVDDDKAALDDGGIIDEDELAASLQKKRLSGKKLVIFGVLPLLLLLGGGGAAYVMGVFGSGEDDKEVVDSAKTVDPDKLVFYELPEMLVNLNTGGRKANYLKLRVALELHDPEAVPYLEARLPRIVDNFQVYLRELRIDDLKGSAGMFRLKEELLSRVNKAVHPTRVSDVLFKEMLVQ